MSTIPAMLQESPELGGRVRVTADVGCYNAKSAAVFDADGFEAARSLAAVSTALNDEVLSIADASWPRRLWEYAGFTSRPTPLSQSNGHRPTALALARVVGTMERRKPVRTTPNTSHPTDRRACPECRGRGFVLV